MVSRKVYSFLLCLVLPLWIAVLPVEASDRDKDRSLLSNALLVDGMTRRRKSIMRAYTPLTQYKPMSLVSREERFLQLLLTSLGFVGIFLAILALRSLPPPPTKS